MCRLAAYPPGFKAQDALKVMEIQCAGNHDGTGQARWHKGASDIRKWPIGLPEVIRTKLPFLDHMPYEGWTIAHVRTKTHGEVAYRNTHPFKQGEWLVCHNGVWAGHGIARRLFRKHIKLEGETDSEVAASMIAEVGPVDFYEAVESYAGVFLCLNRNGELWVVKRGGSLNAVEYKDGTILLASDLRDPLPWRTVNDGWYHLSADGKMKDSMVKQDSWSSRLPLFLGDDGIIDSASLAEATRPRNHHPSKGSPKEQHLFNPEAYRHDRRLEMDLDDELTPAMREQGWHISADGAIMNNRPVSHCKIHGAKPIITCPTCKLQPKCSHGFARVDCRMCPPNVIIYDLDGKPAGSTSNVPCKHMNPEGSAHCGWCRAEELNRERIEHPQIKIKARDAVVPSTKDFLSWIHKGEAKK